MSIKSKPIKELPVEQFEKAVNPIKEVVQDNNNPLSVVQEPVSEISENYDSMSLSELKKIAKEKKIKGYTKIEVKDELIKLIKKAPPTLL